MGKMKLAKDNKKQNAASRGKSGIPNWLLVTIITVVVVAVLLTCVISFGKSSGIVMRLGKAMKSADYSVSGNMMQYFYANTYSNFTSTYESYLSYLSIGAAESMDDHSDILIGGTDEKPNTYDTMFFGDYAGKSWREYFMDQTVSSVKTMLIYCEEADELGITLDDTDKQTIEDAIDATVTQFRLYNMTNGGGGSLSESACFAAMYGEGMKRADIREAMELSTLASKCSQQIYDTIEAAVGDDRINKEYENNKLDYDLADHLYYSFSVDYDDVVEKIVGDDAEDSEIEAKKDEILAEYKAQIADAKAKAAALAACTDLDAFKAYILKEAATEDYETLYEKIKLEEADKVDADTDKIVKEQIISAVVKEVLEGADRTADIVTETTSGEGDAATTTYKIGTFDVTETFAAEIRTLKETLFTNTSDVIDNYTSKKTAYKADDDLCEWLFNADRKIGDITTISDGDGASDGEITAKDEYFSADVCYVLTPRYKNETLSRDVAYMLFSSSTDAKAAITKLKDITEMSKEKFEAMATELSAEANTVWEDYVEGDMGSASFDAWLFDEATVPGTLTDDPITMSDGSIMVAYYVQEGDMPSWKMTVKTSLIEEDFSAREDEMTVAHSTSIKNVDWVLNRVAK